MEKAVVPELVPSGLDLTHDLWVSVRIPALYKEGRPDSFRLQGLQDVTRAARAQFAVKGQRHVWHGTVALPDLVLGKVADRLL